jgi:hypothetical protein
MKVLTIAATTVISLSAAASAAPKPHDGATVTDSLGCVAIDTAGAEFTDPAGRFHQVVTPSGNINQSCSGQLPAGAVLPTAPVTFNQNSGTGFVCLQKWEETIQPDGSFVLNCHLKP